MPRFKLVDGVSIQFTAEEETARDAEEATYAAGAFDRAIAGVRSKRNALIAATDYLALSDNTLSTEMTTYRQALRDITNSVTTVDQVNAITWPTKPE
jgi:hypothetical protein